MGVPLVARKMVRLGLPVYSRRCTLLSQLASVCRPIGGYHHMIQFWWSRVFDQPAIQELDYFCRLDTDSVLVSRVSKDIFAFMHANSYLYGYIHQDTDVRDVVDGMWDFVDEYITSHPSAGQHAQRNHWRIAPNETRHQAEFDIYFNNFEACISYVACCMLPARSLTQSVHPGSECSGLQNGSRTSRVQHCSTAHKQHIQQTLGRCPPPVRSLSPVF